MPTLAFHTLIERNRHHLRASSQPFMSPPSCVRRKFDAKSDSCAANMASFRSTWTSPRKKIRDEIVFSTAQIGFDNRLDERKIVLKTLATGQDGDAIQTQLMPSSPELGESRKINSKVWPRFSTDNHVCGGSLRILPSMTHSDAQGTVDEMSSGIQAENAWVQMQVSQHMQMVGKSLYLTRPRCS